MAARDRLVKGLRNPGKIPPYIKARLLDLYYHFDSKQTNIYEKEWELLIILDGCRRDTMEEVSDEYSFLPDSIPSITSVGGGSPDWLANTFSEQWLEEVRQTGYITGNPHTRRVLSGQMEGLFAEIGGPEDRLSDFDYFAPLWETHWDNKLGTVPARAVSDHLIQRYRSQPSRRTIAHYMQPHFPSVPDPIGDGMDLSNEAHWNSEDVWTLLQEGVITKEEAYTSYVANLRYVLDDIELVLSNLDSERVVITADHGNAFGEWGEYSHGKPYLGVVRTVPWIETSAQDKEEYTPKVEETTRGESQSVEEKLRALGYKT